jgi:hypothetical protein
VAIDVKPRYENSAAALKAVESEYQYWSGKLTESSFQLCVAIIAANWAVYQDVDRLRANPYAIWSICLVVATLAISLLVSKRMSEAHREQCEYAEKESKKWEQEYEAAPNAPGAWPFTDEIENIGWVARGLKTFLPLIAGALFVMGVLSHGKPGDTNSAGDSSGLTPHAVSATLDSHPSPSAP